MIHDVTGDILESRAAVIAHGLAPNDPCDRGLALALRERWPSMYQDLRHYYHASHPSPGEIWTWSGPGGRIACLFTQEEAPHRGHGHPGRATLSHVHHALKALAKQITAEGYSSVAIPKLATGVGGLDWKDVEPMIRADLGGVGVPIYLYSTYRPGVVAEEPR